MGKDDKVRVNIYITEALNKRLDGFCEKNHGAPRSGIIEAALKEYLDREEKRK